MGKKARKRARAGNVYGGSGSLNTYTSTSLTLCYNNIASQNNGTQGIRDSSPNSESRIQFASYHQRGYDASPLKPGPPNHGVEQQFTRDSNELVRSTWEMCNGDNSLRLDFNSYGNSQNDIAGSLSEEPLSKKPCLSNDYLNQRDHEINHVPPEHNISRATKRTTEYNHDMQTTGTENQPSIPFKWSIIPVDYPKTLLENEHLEEIQMAIFEELEAIPDPLPNFVMGVVNPLGVIPVTCNGYRSVSFLRSFDGFTLQGGIQLKIVRYRDLPKLIKMIWKSQNFVCRDLARVFKMLERCNHGLNTYLWKVVDSVREKHVVRRIVLVDTASADYIKSKKYTLPDGLGVSKFEFFRLKYRSRPKQTKSKSVQTKPENLPTTWIQSESDIDDKIEVRKTVNSCSQTEDLKVEDKHELNTSAQQVGLIERLSWGGIVETNEETPIDLTEDYSSYEDDDQDFTGEL